MYVDLGLFALGLDSTNVDKRLVRALRLNYERIGGTMMMRASLLQPDHTEK